MKYERKLVQIKNFCKFKLKLRKLELKIKIYNH